ncbi:MAG: hypothetical protein ACOZF0_13770 [Thermodesulfobacteriota bacterium]
MAAFRKNLFCLSLLLPLIAAGGFCRAETAASRQGVYLSVYTEPYQKAFFILVPRGWRAEGGMLPSGVEWNVVDLVEHNIRFRVTSPDGQSFFGWYPRFYFQDPRTLYQSSYGMLQMQPGQVMNGCWLFPYMDVAQYVRQIVFGQFAAAEFQNPRLTGGVVKDSTLQSWAPRVATRCDYGYVNFECGIQGRPSFGRIYSINYDLQGLIWSTVGTFGWVAPKSRWKSDERIMELCIRSFRLNPEWARRAAEAASQRARQYHQTIQEMNRIDAEISRNRSQTRSDIQEEFYKVITDQIETRDPETGQTQYLPMYNHAYTDGRGNYFLRDTDDGTVPFENASEWRKLKIVNRNEPDYRPE